MASITTVKIHPLIGFIVYRLTGLTASKVYVNYNVAEDNNIATVTLPKNNLDLLKLSFSLPLDLSKQPEADITRCVKRALEMHFESLPREDRLERLKMLKQS